MADFFRRSHPIARKHHTCAWCTGGIPEGTRHHYSVGRVDGVFAFYRYHITACARTAAPGCDCYAPDPPRRRRKESPRAAVA